jgi:hypothetical protein
VGANLLISDIKNTHLINGLQNLGVDADFYTSKSSEVIFSLMKIDASEDVEHIHKQYYDLMKWSFQKDGVVDLDRVADSLYCFLEECSD